MKKHLNEAKVKKIQKWIINFCAENRCSLSKSELQFFYELCILLDQIGQKDQVRSVVVKNLLLIGRNVVSMFIRNLIGK